jgi:hypothetical protein
VITLDATERKVLTLTTFTAACVCFAPAELVSGVLLLIVSALLLRWDRAVTRREALLAPVSPPVVVGPAPAESPPATE